MTPKEAEAVIERFREQEEAFNREMEARASMPTVKDLAEGLDVPPERVEQILQEVRRQAHAPAQNGVPSQVAMSVVKPQNRNALVIGAVLLAVMVLLGLLAVLFMTASPAPSTAPPAPPITDAQAVAADSEGAAAAPETSTPGRD